jgi:hypothetical protein
MAHNRTRKGTPVTLEELHERVKKLEARAQADLKANLVSRTWWETHAGRFENDPVFDEIVRLGRQQRFADRSPGHRRKRSAGSRH